MSAILVILIVLIVMGFFTGAFGGRPRVIKVDSFHTDDAALPGNARKLPEEQTLIHATSPAGRAQVFVTNKRVFVYTRTFLGSAWGSSHMPISTVLVVGIENSNPWGFLVVGALGLIAGIVSREVAGYTGGILWAAVFGLVWYFLKSAAFVIQNGRASYRVLSKSEDGLAHIVHAIDQLRLVDTPPPPSLL